jgi:NAD(P)-dependent dehydrogenase (short-subunit alcohol dehydrogenase family)
MASTVVITGGSRGFGAGLARAFLARDWNVAVCARHPVAADSGELPAAAGQLLLVVSDMGSAEGAAHLAQQAIDRFGGIDIWINNAGFAYGGPLLAEAEPAPLRAMVETNVLGTLLGCRAAATVMADGAIYNIYGAGSDGRYVPAMVAYGTTKRAVDYLTRALAAELLPKGMLVGGISPGLLMTEPVLKSLRGLSGQALAARARVVNIIGDDVNIVAEWAVEKILQNRQTGRVFVRLTAARLLGRRLRSLWRPRDVLSAHGIGVKKGAGETR